MSHEGMDLLGKKNVLLDIYKVILNFLRKNTYQFYFTAGERI